MIISALDFPSTEIIPAQAGIQEISRTAGFRIAPAMRACLE